MVMCRVAGSAFNCRVSDAVGAGMFICTMSGLNSQICNSPSPALAAASPC